MMDSDWEESSMMDSDWEESSMMDSDSEESSMMDSDWEESTTREDNRTISVQEQFITDADVLCGRFVGMTKSQKKQSLECTVIEPKFDEWAKQADKEQFYKGILSEVAKKKGKFLVQDPAITSLWKEQSDDCVTKMIELSFKSLQRQSPAKESKAPGTVVRIRKHDILCGTRWSRHKQNLKKALVDAHLTRYANAVDKLQFHEDLYSEVIDKGGRFLFWRDDTGLVVLDKEDALPKMKSSFSSGLSQQNINANVNNNKVETHKRPGRHVRRISTTRGHRESAKKKQSSLDERGEEEFNVRSLQSDRLFPSMDTRLVSPAVATKSKTVHRPVYGAVGPGKSSSIASAKPKTVQPRINEAVGPGKSSSVAAAKPKAVQSPIHEAMGAQKSSSFAATKPKKVQPSGHKVVGRDNVSFSGKIDRDMASNVVHQIETEKCVTDQVGDKASNKTEDDPSEVKTDPARGRAYGVADKTCIEAIDKDSTNETFDLEKKTRSNTSKANKNDEELPILAEANTQKKDPGKRSFPQEVIGISEVKSSVQHVEDPDSIEDRVKPTKKLKANSTIPEGDPIAAKMAEELLNDLKSLDQLHRKSDCRDIFFKASVTMGLFPASGNIQRNGLAVFLKVGQKNKAWIDDWELAAKAMKQFHKDDDVHNHAKALVSLLWDSATGNDMNANTLILPVVEKVLESSSNTETVKKALTFLWNVARTPEGRDVIRNGHDDIERCGCLLAITSKRMGEASVSQNMTKDLWALLDLMRGICPTPNVTPTFSG